MHFLDVTMEPNTKFSHRRFSDWHAGIFVIKGQGHFGGHKDKAKEGDLIIFKNEFIDYECDLISAETENQDCRFLLFAGKQVPEEIVKKDLWVGASEEEVLKCENEFNEHKGGFEKISDWKPSLNLKKK